MKEWLKKHKSEIIVGIIVFLITSFFSKIVQILIHFAPSAGNSVFIKMRDFIYYQAGHQSVHGNIGQTLTILYSFILVPAVYYGVQGLRDSQNASRVEKVKEIVDLLEKKETFDSGDKKQLEKAKKLSLKAERSVARSKQSNPKHIKAVSIFITVFVLVFACYILVYNYIPIMLSHAFELSMVEIAPYIDEDEEEIIRSKWVSMDGMDKYNEIDSYIRNIKDLNGLK